ncbi:unnamed protein product [Agarophyton chilense]
MDPTNIEGLRDMHEPQTADELCGFIHRSRWMETAIFSFEKRSAPLNAVLEEAYKKAGRRKKRAIKGIALQSLSWGQAETEAFSNVQDSLRNAVYLAYPQKGNAICVFTNASNKNWSGVVMQADPPTLLRTLAEQQHKPLAFLGGNFKGAQCNWSTYEQEGYAIVKTFDKLDYRLLDEHPVHLFLDHRNLLFVFSPYAMQPSLGQHIVAKVQRWAVFLSRFE